MSQTAGSSPGDSCPLKPWRTSEPSVNFFPIWASLFAMVSGLPDDFSGTSERERKVKDAVVKRLESEKTTLPCEACRMHYSAYYDKNIGRVLAEPKKETVRQFLIDLRKDIERRNPGKKHWGGDDPYLGWKKKRAMKKKLAAAVIIGSISVVLVCVCVGVVLYADKKRKATEGLENV